MPLKISFTLSDRDLAQFRNRMRAARKSAGATSPDEILAGVRDLVKKLRSGDLSQFVRQRLERVELLVDMLEDAEWDLPASMRNRVVHALTYFAQEDDLIPDNLPGGVGFLDDAIMIELVARELQHEIEAYEDFCRYRNQETKATNSEALAVRKQLLATRRQQLLGRIKRRRQTERSRHTGWRASLW